VGLDVGVYGRGVGRGLQVLREELEGFFVGWGVQQMPGCVCGGGGGHACTDEEAGAGD